jgi:transcription initiation factor TFIIIB Brf1 subunit/transcription initiation factor TFIIB
MRRLKQAALTVLQAPTPTHLSRAFIQTNTEHTMEFAEDDWNLFDLMKKELGEDGNEPPSRCGTPTQRRATAATAVIKKPPIPGFGNGELMCEACHSREIIVEDGQNVCRNCSLIHSRIIDNGAEWRFYGAEDNRGDDPTRCGMPVNDLLPGSSLGSMVGGNRYDNRDMSRIRQFQMWNSMPYWERELYRVFEKLSAATTSNGIPTKVLYDSKVLYSRASEMKISRGENKEGLIASCIFYACAMNGVPRSTTEIATMFNISSAVLTKGNSRFQALMKLNIQSPNAVDFISRFASQLRLNWGDIEECQDLTLAIEHLEIVSENAPTSVAAGTLYYYCMMKKIEMTKKQVATICNVSEVTITKCYKNLLKYKPHIEAEFSKIRVP